MKQIKVLLLLLFLTSSFLGAEINIKNLKVEYDTTPLGIDVIKPRFSWQMQQDNFQRGARQKAFQLVVTDEAGRVVWNSGKQKNDQSLNMVYAGAALTPSTRYIWKVNVWDQDKKKHTATSWFETGLMNPGMSGWSGAKWIGGGDLVLFAQYLPVFKIDCSIQLDEKTQSTRAGMVYGVNDRRLMDKNKNLFHLENKQNESYVLVELNIAPLATGQSAQLIIYRVGYHPADKKEIPLKTCSIPKSLVSDSNKYAVHDLHIYSNMGLTQVFIDGVEKNNQIADLNINPMGRGGDAIAFPVLGNVGCFVPENQSATFPYVGIRNFRSPSNLLYRTDFQSIKGIKGGSLQVVDPSCNSMPMLRTTFTAPQVKITQARLYVTSRGIYDVYLNGKRINDDYFNPGLTQYNKTQLYQTFDVTELVQEGENVMGAVLGEGWWSGGATYMGEYWNTFGDRQSLLAKLMITYANGKQDVIVTNPSTWQYYNNGPVVYGSFFQGEVYDATKEKLIKGWSKAGYEAKRWKPATEIQTQSTVSTEGEDNRPAINDFSKLVFKGQFGTTVQKVRELTAQSMEEVRPGVYVYDMGQNMVGVPAITLKGTKPGEQIVLRFSEVKYPDLPAYKGNEGMIMCENIRAAMAQDIYITNGGDEVIAPRFTFRGYRYIEITGIEKPLPLEDVKGTVLSSIHQLASHYETSNPKVNRLWENISWSTLGNFLSIPTDCPQRNERLGWSGDISVFSRTASYMGDLPQFLRRHMQAMRDVQREDGRFTDVAPLGGGFGEILWGSAGITVAWESYLQYGDKALLVEHYDAMKQYIGYLVRSIDPETGVLFDSGRNRWDYLGDWLSPEYKKVEKSLLWESYFIFDLEIMSKIATLLGKKVDAAYFSALYTARKKFFNKTYVNPESGETTFRGKVNDTQTSYALPLAFGIIQLENVQKAADNLVATVSRENKADDETVCPPYSLMTGFIGTAWISKALSSTGHSDVAYRLLQQTSYPSWLYPVEQGATTIWERLNSYTPVNGFGGNNSMNSFNHYSFGAVGAWMYNYSLGIERDEQSPGFNHFILQPEPDPTGQMTFAKGYYDSMYGRIESSWEQNSDGCHYRFVVPANSSATLKLKALSLSDITADGKQLKSVVGGKYSGVKHGKYTFELQSGMYEIQVKKGTN